MIRGSTSVLTRGPILTHLQGHLHRRIRCQNHLERGAHETAYEYGVTDYWDAVNAIKRFWKYQIEYKDPFFTKHQIPDKEIEALVDKRFFAGGEYFVDVSEKRQVALNK
jgi:hypothetical protein